MHLCYTTQNLNLKWLVAFDTSTCQCTRVPARNWFAVPVPLKQFLTPVLLRIFPIENLEPRAVLVRFLCILEPGLDLLRVGAQYHRVPSGFRYGCRKIQVHLAFTEAQGLLCQRPCVRPGGYLP